GVVDRRPCQFVVGLAGLIVPALDPFARYRLHDLAKEKGVQPQEMRRQCLDAEECSQSRRIVYRMRLPDPARQSIEVAQIASRRATRLLRKKFPPACGLL